MKEFDIIIPLASKDIDFISRVVDYLTRCIEGISHIFIITKKLNFRKVEKQIKLFKECQIIDEDSIASELSFLRVKNLLAELAPDKVDKTGWYFQQLLKFGFSRSVYSSEYYLSWDSDTLPLAPISFFENNNILFNPKNEFNPNYFKTIENLFGFGKMADYSFISENMMFSADIVKQMITEIEESNCAGSDWVEKILYACDFNSPLPAFSEFETYGSYCYKRHPYLYKQRHLNTFREAGMIAGKFISEKKLRLLSFDVDVASFERGHEPVFPYNLPQIFDRIIRLLKKGPKALWNKLIRKKMDMDIIKVESILYRLPQKK